MGLTLSFFVLFVCCFLFVWRGSGDLALLVTHQIQNPRSNADAGSILLRD